jgi:endonuclease YncB( thermonuclease family)
MRRGRALIALGAVLLALLVAALTVHRLSQLPKPPAGWEVVDHVADGDTIVLGGGVTIRLVQIDTPEVFFSPECYGHEASAETKGLLPRGSFVRLARDPATDSTDAFGRKLRYVLRTDKLNVNVQLVADGAAAPYFFGGVRGEYAEALLDAAETARSAGRGLWGACPRTDLRPNEGVSTGPEDR